MADLEELIARAIAEYDPGDHPMATRLREIVSEHRILPLMFDMAVCVGIRADLTVCDVLWEDWGDWKLADGPRLAVGHVSRDRPIAIGALRYPELRALLPTDRAPHRSARYATKRASALMDFHASSAAGSGGSRNDGARPSTSASTCRSSLGAEKLTGPPVQLAGAPFHLADLKPWLARFARV